MTSEKPRELPSWTRVAAYAIATDRDGRVLLVRVAHGYAEAGQWTLPGGGLQFGEDPVRGALRELTEETGLEGEIDSLAYLSSITIPERPEINVGAMHWIRIVYRVTITGGELRDEQDESTDAAAWFTRAEIQALPIVELAESALEHLDAE